MRTISAESLVDRVAEMCIEANRNLAPDVFAAFEKAKQTEESPLGKQLLERLVENAELARDQKLPICQDTGLATFFIDVGQDVCVQGNLTEAINDGVRKGYAEGYLRKSTAHPLTRKNLGDNTPAIIHYRIVPGDKLHISYMAKGGGSENMSLVKMLKPAQGLDGIRDVVVETVKTAGGNPCPPIVVGVGIGGSFEQCAINAKRALFRSLDEINPDPEWAAVEADFLEAVNDTGVGPQGFGGRTTALAVQIIAQPCHIASLPVGVNIQCHAIRHKEITI